MIWCVERLRQNQKSLTKTTLKLWEATHILATAEVPKINYSKIKGELRQAQIRAAIAEKFAERAFNLASSANLGVIALQKSLATPKLMTAQQSIKNQLAKKQIDNIFETSSGFDYLRPLLSDEDNDILDSIEQQKLKAAARNGAI